MSNRQLTKPAGKVVIQWGKMAQRAKKGEKLSTSKRTNLIGINLTFDSETETLNGMIKFANKKLEGVSIEEVESAINTLLDNLKQE